MSRAVEQIKDRLSIVDVLSTYLKLEQTGSNYKAVCPFHTEKTPSFFISPLRNSYYCFGCGAKGDIFTFVEAFEGLDFRGALTTLAERAGVTLQYQNKVVQDEKERLFTLMEYATTYFVTALTKNKAAENYLLDRGLTKETIQKFRIGYAPADWRHMSVEAGKHSYTEKELEQAGLIKRHERGYYERFRDRIMFPITDSSGRVIAFSGRSLSLDETIPKYLNSPDTLLFDKSSTLYGIDQAKDEIRKRNYAVLVEGQFDLILSHQAGIKNTVAASGTALSDATPSGERGIPNLRLLSRFSKNVVFAFDGDTAGIAASYRGGILALGLGMDVKMATLPKGKDPADIIREGKEIWVETLKKTEHIISFFTKHIQEIPDERKRNKQIETVVLPLVLRVQSAIDQEYFLHTLSKETGISLEALHNEIQKLQETKQEGSIVKQPEVLTQHPEQSLASRLVGIYLLQMQKKETDTVVHLESELKRLFGEEAFHSLVDSMRENAEVLLFEAEAVYDTHEKLQREIPILLKRLEKEMIQNRLKELSREIRLRELKNEETDTLLKEAHDKNTLLAKLEASP